MPESRSALLLVALLVSMPANAFGGKPKAAPLFSDNELVELTITAPFSTIMRERRIDEDTRGSLSYYDVDEGEVLLDIGIRTRGNFRRKREVCPFAPLWLDFHKTKGTLFAKSKQLKLVTHCRTGSPRYTQVLLREYVAYRILNLLTDKSFRVRLLRVKYVESESGKIVDHNYAFLIEHRKQLAKRIGLKVDKSDSTTVTAIDGVHTNLVSMFQYLIGNTDFSPLRGADGERCCHNSVLMGNDSGTLLSVPYDFDMSGLVSAPYASPNPGFRLRNVRQRLYRGRCINNEYLDRTIGLFNDRRQAILDMVSSVPGITRPTAGKTTRYIMDFYKIVNSPQQVRSRIRDRCLG